MLCLFPSLQTVVRACSAYPCTDWFMAHAPLLLAPHPGGVVLGRELPHLGGDQVRDPKPCMLCCAVLARELPHLGGDQVEALNPARCAVLCWRGSCRTWGATRSETLNPTR